jgi:hypothetical protein
MDPLMTTLAKGLIGAGLALVLLGLVLLVASRIPGPGLGRLPGDIVVKRPGFTFYFPLVTCILLSLALTLVGWLIAWLRRP